MTNADPARAAYLRDRAASLVSCGMDTDGLAAWMRDHAPHADPAKITPRADADVITSAALGVALALLAEIAHGPLAALADGPAPRTAPAEVCDEDGQRTRAELSDTGIWPRWAVSLTIGADEWPNRATSLDPGTADALAVGIRALAVEAARRNADDDGPALRPVPATENPITAAARRGLPLAGDPYPLA